MILTTFYYHLLLWNFALNGPPEAADDPYLHPGVALEATIGIQNFWVFPNQLTFLSMGKVVSCLSEFLRILGITVGCTVKGYIEISMMRVSESNKNGAVALLSIYRSRNNNPLPAECH